MQPGAEETCARKCLLPGVSQPVLQQAFLQEELLVMDMNLKPKWQRTIDQRHGLSSFMVDEHFLPFAAFTTVTGKKFFKRF
jgi:hypothetical protein